MTYVPSRKHLGTLFACAFCPRPLQVHRMPLLAFARTYPPLTRVPLPRTHPLGLLLCRVDHARKLEQQELEATYTDAWAVGGSEESDCVCRGGRCPRMWDCPFWVDRRRAEAKGSSAHVRTGACGEIPGQRDVQFVVPTHTCASQQLPTSTGDKWQTVHVWVLTWLVSW